MTGRGAGGRARVTVVVLALGVVRCAAAQAPLPVDGPPRELSFGAYTGWDTEGTSVRARGDTVVTYRGQRHNVEVARRVPTAAEWRAFWRSVVDAGVARWPPQCNDPGVSDGETFTYVLAWDGERRAGTYYAAFPTANGACASAAPSRAARAFRAAVYALAGVPSVGVLRAP